MKGSKILSIIAVAAAIGGGAVAISKYLKKKGINLRDALDYKNNIYGEDELIASEFDVEDATVIDIPDPIEDDIDEDELSKLEIPDIDDDEDEE